MMTAEEYLKRYREAKTLIEIEQNRRKTLLEIAILSGVDYTRITVQSAPEDCIPDIVTKLVQMDDDITRKIRELINIENDIKEKIDRIPDATQREVLQLRFIFCDRWENIADKIGYSISQTFRIYSKALAAMEQALKISKKSLN